VFLDRDGTLMRDVDYCGHPNDVHVFPCASESLRRMKAAGYRVIVITNQSGIGRGYFNEQQYLMVQQEVTRQVGQGLIDATYYCPHRPNENCSCRKPAPEMVHRAAEEQRVDLTRSFFVGDKQSDLECGRSAGVKTILVRTGYGEQTDTRLADIVVNDLTEVADVIVRWTAGAAPEK
jgi:D-glycero-D-manno-heptose 1,7-bisphosphate phosphatase